jgi:hypothetical protein
MIGIAVASDKKAAVLAGKIFDFSSEVRGHRPIISLEIMTDKVYFPLLVKEGCPKGGVVVSKNTPPACRLPPLVKGRICLYLG